MLAAAENRLRMAQALQLKGRDVQAIEVCRNVINSVKERCDHPDVIQLISVALGLISDSLEKTEDVSLAAYYKRAQRQFLETLKAIKSPDEDSNEVISPGVRRSQLHSILDSLENPRLPTDPGEAMAKIRESMENARRQKISEMLESLDVTGEHPAPRKKKVKYESCFDWILDNPLKAMLLATLIVILLFYGLIRIFVLPSLKTREVSAERLKKLKELEEYLRKNMNDL